MKTFTNQRATCVGWVFYFLSFFFFRGRGFGSLPWIQRTNQSPTHIFFLSRTGANVCVFAERLTASNVLPGRKVEGTMQMAIYSCHSVLHLSMFFRMKSELFVVTYNLLHGPLSVYITSLFSPKAYLWPLITSVHFRAFGNAIRLHILPDWFLPAL